jgi:DNA-binding NtrC family response regulator
MHDIKSIKEKVASMRILVVDDEALIRTSMVGFMERLFGEVIGAVDGQDALEKFNQHGPFDMVLTDVRMPRMSGSELIKELRHKDKNLFIAVMSAAPEDAENNGQYDDVFMEKPIGFDSILDALEQMIQSKGL